MPVRKPLVMIAGQIQQLPLGDSLPDATSNISILATYAASTDLMNNTSISAATWTDLTPDLSFSVSGTSDIIEVLASIAVTISAGSGVTKSARLAFDTGGTPTYVMVSGALAGSFATISGGAAVITGLAAGTHTVKFQFYSDGSANAYCRPAAHPDIEFANITVLRLR